VKTIKPALIPLLVVLALVAFAPIASAVPVGILDVANCPAGGVTVTATSIDWQLPVDAGTGCIATGSMTSLTYSGGTLGPNVTGTILDLTTSTPLPVSGFMTFSSTPLNFTLNNLGPGSSNLSCGTLTIGNSCSVAADSPFILTLLAGNQTAVSLSAFGTVTDGAGVSNWSGAFTTQVPNMTPAQIQTTFLTNPNAFINDTYSSGFVVTAVPEPATLTLFGTGLLAVVRKRRRSA
jgi:hypothetical protein